MAPSDPAAPLSSDAIAAFVRDGFVRIDHAFDSRTAAEARSILWAETGCDPDDPASWTQPVIRLDQFGQPPFRAAANTPILHAAFDQLVGHGNWQPRRTLGTFPVRFPSTESAGDDGWHVDMSFGTEAADFMDWRINIRSRGRALLMLLLFSDTGASDAPTRIRAGSHRDIARQVAPAGEAGMTLRMLAEDGFARSAHRDEHLATGAAGTVYLCHPFLVHAAQRHHGTTARFLAQPPLLPADPVDGGVDPAFPVGAAIRAALADG